MRILVSGGGTAGHISPILATIEAIRARQPQAEFLYVGQAGSMEATIAKAAGLPFRSIRAGKLRRFHDMSWFARAIDVKTLALNARDVSRVARGVRQSLRILREFRPDIIFIKGGYVGLPVGIAASMLRIPYVIHESDMRAGLANRILAKRAAVVAVGFPPVGYKDLPQSKLEYTGNPINERIMTLQPAAARKHFGFTAAKPVVMVTGGSQGSHVMNEVVLEALPELLRHYQVLHITGEADIEHVRFWLRKHPDVDTSQYVCTAFLRDDMPEALVASDVVVARGGASTLAELAVLAKPAIIVPHPGLGDQTLNAQTLARAGAIRLIPQASLNKSVLLRELAQVTGSAKERKLLGESLSHYAKQHAAANLAELILSVAPQAEEADDATATD